MFLKPTSHMYIFSVLVTDNLNYWFAVKPDICNLKTHARLHDCTRLQTSNHEDSQPKTGVRTHSSRRSSHINPTVSPVYLHIIIITKYASCFASVLCDDTGHLTHTRGCIIWLMLSLVTERKTVLCVTIWWSFLLMQLLQLWNTTTLWFSVRVLTPAAGSRSGSVLFYLLLCCPAPSWDWPYISR